PWAKFSTWLERSTILKPIATSANSAPSPTPRTVMKTISPSTAWNARLRRCCALCSASAGAPHQAVGVALVGLLRHGERIVADHEVVVLARGQMLGADHRHLGSVRLDPCG